jgi:hypothetical protein
MKFNEQEKEAIKNAIAKNEIEITLIRDGKEIKVPLFEYSEKNGITTKKSIKV